MALPANLATDDVISEAWVDAVVDSLTALQPSAWTAPTYTNGWTAFDATRLPQYRKVGDWVEMRGILKPGTLGQSAFTLPAGFRPAIVDETFLTVAGGTTTGASNLQCTSAGLVLVGGAGMTYCYLSGVRFSTVA